MNFNPTYFDAVLSLVGGIMSGPSEGPISHIMFDNNNQIGVKKDYTLPTEEAIQAEIARLQAEYDAQAYARNRQAEYPDYGTQLNKIYDDGLTKWKSEMVDPIKAKWPKDNSGPK